MRNITANERSFSGLFIGSVAACNWMHDTGHSDHGGVGWEWEEAISRLSAPTRQGFDVQLQDTTVNVTSSPRLDFPRAAFRCGAQAEPSCLYVSSHAAPSKLKLSNQLGGDGLPQLVTFKLQTACMRRALSLLIPSQACTNLGRPSNSRVGQLACREKMSAATSAAARPMTVATCRARRAWPTKGSQQQSC
jgi:hypothetical protein